MGTPANRGTAVLKLPYGTTLGAWTTVAIPGESGTHDGVAFAIVPNGELSSVVVTVPATAAPDGRLFLRLSRAAN